MKAQQWPAKAVLNVGCELDGCHYRVDGMESIQNVHALLLRHSLNHIAEGLQQKAAVKPAPKTGGK